MDALAAAVREMGQHIDEAFGVGAFHHLARTGIAQGVLGGSWLAVFLRRPETRDADLDYLAGRLARRWKLREQDKPRLRELARDNRCSLREAKFNLARTGMVLASDALRAPQVVRLGKLAFLP